jgi:hypothetical protein
MEVVRELPLDAQNQIVLGGYAPHPLLLAAHAVEVSKKTVGGSVDYFPMLIRVREFSEAYIDENLWLSPEEVVELLDQFLQLRRVCQQQEFLSGLDGRKVAHVWRDSESPAEFERWLDGIEALLWKAVEGHNCLRLML